MTERTNEQRAREIVREACNQHRNSDLRADDRDIHAGIVAALDEKDREAVVFKRKAEALTALMATLMPLGSQLGPVDDSGPGFAHYVTLSRSAWNDVKRAIEAAKESHERS